MKADKIKRLERNGWKVGSASEFLGLSEQEAAYVSLKLAFSESLKSSRLAQQMTQANLAKIIGSNQSRVARMEAADPSVSIDSLIKALLALGLSKQQLATAISLAA
ncbi:MAG: hypothetical protein DHS20C11_30010 [Lysobacteraceae bacterium]|nr:MAG: hypothetical protein DHS20C11_30010 [Xanthomonadaceae bacterium]